MNRKVYLTLTGRQKDETGEIAVTRHSCDGEFFEKNHTVYLLYDETPDGTGAVVKNTVKLKNSVLELNKRGSINARMVFEPGREYLTDYITPYGRLKMGISTRSLDVRRKEDQLCIEIAYSLTSEGIPISDCSLSLICHS